MQKFLMLLFLIVFLIPTTIYAAPSSERKAAFIRGNDLWIKVGNKEKKITDGQYIRYPKWSFDGSWISYLKGTKNNEYKIYNGELWLYNLKYNKHFKIKSNINNNYQWALQQNKIAFQENKVLYYLNAELFNQNEITFVSKPIENFSWLPDGKGFLTSSKESPNLHSDIILSKILFSKSGKQVSSHLYTIPVSSDDFHVSTCPFKWSNDMKWISFLLVPTASLSADSNTLCILSQDGQFFQKVDEMLNYEEWFQWTLTKSSIGYISGVGREATANKQLQILGVPTFKKEIITPKGYSDRDLVWKNDQLLYVSRSLESNEGELDKRPLPSLYKINLANHKQIQLTFPSKNEGDFRPQIIKNQLVWIRTDRQSANVFISPVSHLKGNVWIKDIDLGSTYYEKWNWDEVLSLYGGGN
ncbi:translocation protein TolB [Bacillus sp. CGMCC 1.16607]|uniref:translocation protein TolB n=1 Tax=Bacillus sp. CGMCC 1.16607 TaxID=3351842 RepID=UPI003631B3D8